jgi:hypothetical protein
MRYLIAALLLSGCAVGTEPINSLPPIESTVPRTTTVAPAPKPSPSQIAASAPKESVSNASLLENALRQNNPCGQWLDAALDAGWPIELWPQQAYVIWRESRCNIGSWNQDDPNGGSRGLMQINGFWCQKWLQQQNVLSTCDELFDPNVNLRAAWAIFNYSVGKNANGWNPWSMKADFDPPTVVG